MLTYFEKNNTINDGLAYKHAYDMLVCSADVKLAENQQSQNLKGIKNKQQIRGVVSKTIKLLSSNNVPRGDKPLHDSFADFVIAKGGKDIILDVWQKLIQNHGKKAMELFARADDIERKKAELANKSDQHLPPKDLDEALELKLQVSYKRANEHIEMAKIFNQYNVSQDVFNKSLDIALSKEALKPKTRDNLPNIVINGNEIEEVDAKGYFLVKIPINDPRAYILGKITNCCQSIGGHSEQCVIDGVTRENNGFYILLKGDKNITYSIMPNSPINYDKFKIVGQGYAWLSHAGNLTFDSWDNLRHEQDGKLNDDAIIVPMLKKFAEKAIKEGNIVRALP